MFEEAGVGAPLGGWWDRAMLRAVADINERMLASLQRRVRVPAAQGGPLPALLEVLAEEWCTLDAPLQQRLAACPCLLLDTGALCAGAWQRSGAAVHDAALAGRYFSDADALLLARRAVLLGWHLARANRLAARVLLGLSAPAVERLAEARLDDLEALAEHLCGRLAPRWAQQPLIWRQLLREARHGQAARLRAVQLRGLQLLAGAGLPA